MSVIGDRIALVRAALVRGLPSIGDLARQASGDGTKFLAGDGAFKTGGGSGTGLFTDINLSSATLKGLSTTPVVLVAAQGVNTIITPKSYFVAYTYGTSTYAINGNNFDAEARYDLGTPGDNKQLANPLTFVDGTPTNAENFAVQSAFLYFAPDTHFNKGVILAQEAGSAYITGDGTVRIITFYDVVNLS